MRVILFALWGRRSWTIETPFYWDPRNQRKIFHVGEKIKLIYLQTQHALSDLID